MAKGNCTECGRPTSAADDSMGRWICLACIANMAGDDDAPAHAADLDVVGKMFGLKFGEGKDNFAVDLYVEDDGNYFKATTFHRSWLDDLIEVATRAKANMPRRRRRA